MKEYYSRGLNPEVALWVQGFPPVLQRALSRKELMDFLADAMPPIVAYNLFRLTNAKGKAFLDLFAGIGGWALGFALFMYPEPIYVEAVELDREKSKVLNVLLSFVKSFYPEMQYNVVVKDVRDYELSKDFDVIAASPPCEDVSPLNAFQGFREYKGTVELTEVFVEKVKDVRAKVFYENVYDARLEKLLKAAGFTVRKVDFSEFIPQRRVRLIATKNVAVQTKLA
jgi:site-specific DNA-cytosine methylase